MESKIEKQPS